MIHTSSWAGRFHSAVGGVAYGASKHALSDISASLNAKKAPTASVRPRSARQRWPRPF
ncbi:MAG: hypothetical protein R3D85_00795 [Paracoccaceae bacterium]